AKKLREEMPDLRIIFGGYALEGAPGAIVAKAFPWIDTIVFGDGEEQIVELAREVVDGARYTNPFALGKLRIAKRVDITRSPVPEYSDWFADIENLAKERSVQIKSKGLPVETSRGCWWGQVKHCVFCGIDEDTLKYRYKPAGDTLAMLNTLRERYGDYVFRF